MVAPDTAALAASVALVRSPVSGVSVIPFAVCGPWFTACVEDDDDVVLEEVVLVCACAVPSMDAGSALRPSLRQSKKKARITWERAATDLRAATYQPSTIVG